MRKFVLGVACVATAMSATASYAGGITQIEDEPELVNPQLEQLDANPLYLLAGLIVIGLAVSGGSSTSTTTTTTTTTTN
jgi:hypothetical protein